MIASVENKVQRSYTSPTVLICTLLLVVSGTTGTISLKAQGTLYGYKHGMIQTLVIFFGETLNILGFFLPIWVSKRARRQHFVGLVKEAKSESKGLFPEQLMFGLASLFDAVNTSMQNISLLLLPASIVQILLGANIITSCIVSRILLGRKIRPPHVVGNILALVGFCLVGFASIVSQEAEEVRSFSDTFIGIGLVSVGLFLRALQVNTEEYVFLRYSVSCDRGVGLEGLFGLIWTLCLSIMFSFFPCKNNALCTVGGWIEDPVIGVKEIFSNGGLIGWSLVLVIGVAIYNYCSLALTKHVSCIYTLFWNSTSTLSIWIVSILLGLEQFEVKAFLLQSSGFCFLLLGNLVYNEVIAQKYFKNNIMKKD